MPSGQSPLKSGPAFFLLGPSTAFCCLVATGGCGLFPRPLFKGLGTQVSYTITKVFLPVGEENQAGEWGWVGGGRQGLLAFPGGRGTSAHTWEPGPLACVGGEEHCGKSKG